MSPLFALIAVLSSITTVTGFRTHLQAALMADPALPFVLNVDDSSEILRPFARLPKDLPADLQGSWTP